MPVITCRITADDGPDQYLEDLSSEWWNLQREDRDTDLILVSGEDVSRVHQAVLLPLSPFLENLVPAVFCTCFTPTVILPSIQKDSLTALVELFYTGRTVVGSETAENEVGELMAILQIGVKGQDEEKKDTFDQQSCYSDQKSQQDMSRTPAGQHNFSAGQEALSRTSQQDISIFVLNFT